MKRCPTCQRDYFDDSLLYCLSDGTRLLDGSASSEFPTAHLVPLEPEGYTRYELKKKSLGAAAVFRNKKAGIVLGILLLSAIGIGGYLYFRDVSRQIDSIAVMPFVNQSGNPDLEYLSDGMAEELISSLSRSPNLNVKASSSVFRYKSREISTHDLGTELGVQAILTGRLVQRDDEITLYLSLVEADTENNIWSKPYSGKLADLVVLRTNVVSDVAASLKLRLSDRDSHNITKGSTSDPNALRLYLKGRFHTLKLTLPEVKRGISYFEQAILADPNYARAYVGLADAFRSMALSGELAPVENFPKAKTAALKAIEIDREMAEAYAVLGFVIYYHDWDWKLAEANLRKAVELDLSKADTSFSYGHFLATMGRSDEALIYLRRASEIEPLDLRIATVEMMMTNYSGKPDLALAQANNIFEVDPNYWFAHMNVAAVYIQKEMYAEAVVSARRASEINKFNSQPISLEAYALAKAGKTAEARVALKKLLEIEAERYVPQTNIALAYIGLNEFDKALDKLERAYVEKDPRMVFLKVDHKYDSLRQLPRFQALMKKLVFPTE